MKYSPEMRTKICELLERGMLQKDVATYVGISDDTFHRWKNTKPEFSEALKKAQIGWKQAHIDNIQDASKKHWTASAWLLERRYPEEYAENKKVDLDGKLTLAEFFNEPEDKKGKE